MKLRCLSQLLSRRIPHSTVAPLRFDLTASPSLPPHKATTTSSHKMPLQFSANLNFLFIKENANVLERYRLARRAGFRAVENTFPLDVSVADAVAVQREIGLEVVLLNICVARAGDIGCAALPGMEVEFRQMLHRTVDYAKALGCKKIHLVAGNVPDGRVTEEHHQTYERNLRYAISVLEPAGIVGLIEPISPFRMPNFYLNSFEKAIELITRLGSPSLRLILDLFHLQLITGNVTNRIRELMPYVGHVQVAQVPTRHEPDSAGELNYEYVFKVLAESDYTSWIGLEYEPTADTVCGLERWLTKYGYVL